jgi:hypothetical protein
MRHNLTYEREWQAKTRRKKGVPPSSAGAQTNKQTHKKGTRQRESDRQETKHTAERHGPAVTGRRANKQPVTEHSNKAHPEPSPTAGPRRAGPGRAPWSAKRLSVLPSADTSAACNHPPLSTFCAGLPLSALGAAVSGAMSECFAAPWAPWGHSPDWALEYV